MTFYTNFSVESSLTAVPSKMLDGCIRSKMLDGCRANVRDGCAYVKGEGSRQATYLLVTTYLLYHTTGRRKQRVCAFDPTGQKKKKQNQFACRKVTVCTYRYETAASCKLQLSMLSCTYIYIAGHTFQRGARKQNARAAVQTACFYRYDDPHYEKLLSTAVGVYPQRRQ